MYIGLICFILTFNVYFSIFVWYPSDFSPNQAMGVMSLLFIIWIIYNWIKDRKEFYNAHREKENKDERRLKK